MPVKLLHNLYQGRHRNNCLFLLSTFLPHNQNFHHLRKKRQHQVQSASG